MRPLPGKARKEEALSCPSSRILPYLIVLSVFILDRATKVWAVSALGNGSIAVYPPILSWTLVHNTGAAFGWWKGSVDLLAVFAAVSSGAILWWLRRPVRLGIAWALVAGGALGNLYDRLRFGFVIDYVDVGFWPVFNLADACISCGVGWILIRTLFIERQSKV